MVIRSYLGRSASRTALCYLYSRNLQYTTALPLCSKLYYILIKPWTFSIGIVSKYAAEQQELPHFWDAHGHVFLIIKVPLIGQRKEGGMHRMGWTQWLLQSLIPRSRPHAFQITWRRETRGGADRSVPNASPQPQSLVLVANDSLLIQAVRKHSPRPPASPTKENKRDFWQFARNGSSSSSCWHLMILTLFEPPFTNS